MSAGRGKIVVLGMMTKMPVAGVAWLMAHYLVGFRRLGYDPYYVEAHARTPSMFMEHERDDGARKAAGYIDGVLRRFDLGDSWAYHALHENGSCYGLTESNLRRLYRDAALIVNLHGGTLPLPEHSETGKLVYLETDPVELQVELLNGVREAEAFLEPHVAFFSWGLNYGNPDCNVPLPDRFHFRPTFPPVLLDHWPPSENVGGAYTTVGNWRQPWRNVSLAGEVYTWSKHHEFLKVLELPRRSGRPFELALSSYEESDRHLLEEHGWRVRPALQVSRDLDAYRDYVAGSYGEFTVAKDQNVRLRSGWFSERSATYLAAGRPVITQETGFSNVVPTGHGLFPFSTVEEAAAAVEAIEADYERHRQGALELAREYFAAERVLSKLLAELEVEPRAAARRTGASTFPRDLDLVPVSRFPTTLAASTTSAVLERPVPSFLPCPAAEGEGALVSIVVPTFDSLVFTRLCLESVLANTGHPEYELIVVDNGSSDGTPEYLEALAALNHRVRVMSNHANNGFAAATNQGLAAARGTTLVLLNSDTVVPPGWLARLLAPLAEREVGLVGPLTNRAGNEAQIETPYSTYGGLLDFCRVFAGHDDHGGLADVRTLTLFCAALRREVYEEVGPLDERFQIGMFEDDDYVLRVRLAGYRVVCAGDAFVHHFGQATIGKLATTDRYGQLFHANRRRFEGKWGMPWKTHDRRRNDEYERLVAAVRQAVTRSVPEGATVAVVSKGDDELLELGARAALHFPRGEDGGYAGYYPGDSADAIAQLEGLRRQGAEFFVVPRPARWWLDHYADFGRHLRERYVAVDEREACVIFSLVPGRTAKAPRPVEAAG